MTAATTQVPAVIDYLVATAPAFVPAGTQVFDGPPPVKTALTFEQVLWIGHDPGTPGEATAEAEQDWPVLDQARTVDEDGTVTCVARHWSGDTTVKVHRDGAAAIAGGVELMLRGTTTSGGPGDTQMGGLVFWSHVTGPWQWYPAQLTNGAEMVCVFRVAYRARLMAS